MSRRNAAPKREILPDPKFGNQTLAKFMNNVMKSGKKSVAERIVYGALDLIENKLKTGQFAQSEDEGGSEGGRGRLGPIDIFGKALDNVRPMVEVKSRRVGGATYQVPMEIRPTRSQALAMRWLVDSAKARGEKSMPQRLANELLEAYAGRGNAVKKREETHRMAKANQAFAHYRW